MSNASVIQGQFLETPDTTVKDGADCLFDAADDFYYGNRENPDLHTVIVKKLTTAGVLTVLGTVIPPPHYGCSGFRFAPVPHSTKIRVCCTGHDVIFQPQAQRPHADYYADVEAGYVHPVASAIHPPPAPAGPPRFSDVLETDPFYEAVQSLTVAGVISGYSDHTFRPGAPVTRGQIAAMLWRLWRVLATGGV